MRILPAVVVALAFPIDLAAQESAGFLKIGVGARAIGMGGAATAVSQGAESLAWNPAGLASPGARELGFMHAEMVENTHFDFIGYEQPSRWGAFGLAARRLSQGAIDGRDASGAPNGSFSAGDTAVDLGFARKLGAAAAAGATVRFIQSDIADASAVGYAVDLGTTYQGRRLGPGVPRFGLAVQNFGPGLRFLERSSPLPLTLAAGLGYSLPVGLTFAADYRNRPNSKTSELCAGTEYAFAGGFAFRAGYSRAAGPAGAPGGILGLTGGFGLTLRGYRLDYSITPFGDLGETHRVSLGASF